MSTALSPVGLTYQLGELVFNVIDDSGVSLPADLAGWDEVPDPIGDAVQRPNDDGADFVDLFLPGKPLTLNGLAVCPTQAAAYRMRDQLTAASRLLRETGELFVNEPIPKRVLVRLGGGPVIRWVSERVLQYSIPLTQGDPLRYSSEETSLEVALRSDSALVRAYPRVYDGGLRYRIVAGGSGGQVTIVNAGVESTYPTFTIRGPVVNPVIELAGTGLFMEFEGSLTSTDRLVINTRTRSVRLNGTPSRWLLVDGGFFRLPPGESTLIFRAFAFNPAARLQLDYRSAWL